MTSVAGGGAGGGRDALHRGRSALYAGAPQGSGNPLAGIGAGIATPFITEVLVSSPTLDKVISEKNYVFLDT